MPEQDSQALCSKIVAFLGEADYDNPVEAIYVHFQDKLGYTSTQIYAAVALLMASAERAWGKDWQTKAIN